MEYKRKLGQFTNLKYVGIEESYAIYFFGTLCSVYVHLLQPVEYIFYSFCPVTFPFSVLVDVDNVNKHPRQNITHFTL